MPTSKKRKDKRTVFKATAAAQPLSLHPRHDTDWRPLLAQHIKGLIALAERLGISANALFSEFSYYLDTRALHALPPPPVTRLTPRQIEIVALMADHLSYQQMADILCIELSTLRSHVQNIYKKLGNRGRVLEWWERHRHEYGR